MEKKSKKKAKVKSNRHTSKGLSRTEMDGAARKAFKPVFEEALKLILELVIRYSGRTQDQLEFDDFVNVRSAVRHLEKAALQTHKSLLADETYSSALLDQFNAQARKQATDKSKQERTESLRKPIFDILRSDHSCSAKRCLELLVKQGCLRNVGDDYSIVGSEEPPFKLTSWAAKHSRIKKSLRVELALRKYDLRH